MKYPTFTPKSLFRQDIACGFLGGAMAGFNAGLWLLPQAGILTPAQTLILCIASGIATALMIARVKS